MTRVDLTGTIGTQTEVLMDYLDNMIRWQLDRGGVGPLIFDIDDTLITGRNDTIIEPVAKLYRKYVHRLPVYICTARPWSKTNEALTLQMLQKKNLNGFRAMYMLPPHMEPGRFKWSTRQQIQKLHDRPIFARIGDCLWDAAPTPCASALSDLESYRHGGAILSNVYGSEMGILLPSRGH